MGACQSRTLSSNPSLSVISARSRITLPSCNRAEQNILQQYCHTSINLKGDMLVAGDGEVSQKSSQKISQSIIKHHEVCEQ